MRIRTAPTNSILLFLETLTLYKRSSKWKRLVFIVRLSVYVERSRIDF